METTKPTIDDLVFENRNKAYGAYLLRQIYSRHLGIALLVVSSVLFLMLASRLGYVRFFAGKEVLEKKKVVELKMEEIEIPSLDPTAPPPPPPPPLEEPKVKTIRHVPPVVVPDEKILHEEKIATENEIDSAAISSKTADGEADNGLNNAPLEGVAGGTGVVETPEDNTVYFSAGLPAAFPGGIDALGRYMQKKFEKTKEKASRLGDKGTVIVAFVVEKDGTISSVKAIKELAICKTCNEDAIEIIRSMPKWEPGKNNGVPVRMQFTLPIKFDFED